MITQEELKELLRHNCPLLWELLNNRAKRILPKGLVDYIASGNPSNIKSGRSNLNIVEKHLKLLEDLCGWNSVRDNYRKDLSGATSENRLAEIFCEIALCAQLGKISKKINLRPPTGKGTYSDCGFNLQGYEIFAEVKRYPDPWPAIEQPDAGNGEPVAYTRFITEDSSRDNPRDSANARSMELRSKLLDVHRQFPEKEYNILFIFHRSFDSHRYLGQTLFGDSNYFLENNEGLTLKPDGLFHNESWRIISVCFLARINESCDVVFPYYWKNPLAIRSLPDSIMETFGPRAEKDFVERDALK